MTVSINEPHAVLWSGGKDSCLALWQARQRGVCVSGLLNLFDGTSGRVRFHAVRASLIAEQAHALNLDIFQYETRSDSYAATLSDALHKLKVCGYAGVIAGDIHLENVRQWNEEQASEAGLRLLEPLWHKGGANMLQTFVSAGFRAVVTCSEDKWPNILWLGREIDAAFITDVSGASELDACGENGEYHTFVFDGPLFSRRIKWLPGSVRRSNGFSQIDLLQEGAEIDSV